MKPPIKTQRVEAIAAYERSRRPHCFKCDKPGIRPCCFVVLPGVTCDNRCCSRHLVTVSSGIDYCADHASFAPKVKAKPITSPIRADGRWIQAKFDSKCFDCGMTINTGDRIFWIPSDGQQSTVACESCAENES